MEKGLSTVSITARKGPWESCPKQRGSHIHRHAKLSKIQSVEKAEQIGV